MNQQRWNFLTALLFSTAIAPISSVGAEVTPTISENNDVPPSLKSLPTVTPLTVTADRTDAVIPVPQVSSLPSLTAFGKIENAAPTNKFKITKLGTLQPVKQRHTSAPVVPVTATAPKFSNIRTTASIRSVLSRIETPFISSNQIGSSSSAGTVAQLPQLTAKKLAPGTKSVTSQAATSIFESRSDNAKLAKAPVPPSIINSVTVPAEMTATPVIESAPNSIGNRIEVATRNIPSATNDPVTAVPKVAPLVTYQQDRSDTPSFESGLPVFIFEDERPQQIVATTIAQVGNEIVAPELSIAIPVERPKQVTIPTQLIVATTIAQVGNVIVAPELSIAIPVERPKQVTIPTQLPVSTPAISKIDSPAATTQPVLDKIVATQTGQASWYGAESGNRTANGERFNPNGMTAAHRTLPFGTRVKVTSLKTGKSVVVRINDRGPFRGRRIVDLAAGAAEIIGLKSHGVGDVRMEILDTQS